MVDSSLNDNDDDGGGNGGGGRIKNEMKMVIQISPIFVLMFFLSSRL